MSVPGFTKKRDKKQIQLCCPLLQLQIQAWTLITCCFCFLFLPVSQ